MTRNTAKQLTLIRFSGLGEVKHNSQLPGANDEYIEGDFVEFKDADESSCMLSNYEGEELHLCAVAYKNGKSGAISISLDRETAIRLVVNLSQWIDTGSLRIGAEKIELAEDKDITDALHKPRSKARQAADAETRKLFGIPDDEEA